MCLINADFFPNHHVSCCEINSAPQNHKELRVVMIQVKDLYTQHMNPNMQLIKRLFPPMKKFSINWCQFEFFPCMWKDFRFINNYMDLSDQFFKIFLLVIAEVWKHEIWRTKRKWDAELGFAGPTMTFTIKKTAWMSKSVKIMSQYHKGDQCSMAKQYCILNKLLSLTKRYQSRESKVSFLAKNDNSYFKMTTIKFLLCQRIISNCCQAYHCKWFNSSTMALNMRKRWHPYTYRHYNEYIFCYILFGSKLDLWEHSKLKSCINASLVLTGYFLRLCLTMTSGPYKVTLVLRWQVDWGRFRSDVFFGINIHHLPDEPLQNWSNQAPAFCRQQLIAVWYTRRNRRHVHEAKKEIAETERASVM